MVSLPPGQGLEINPDAPAEVACLGRDCRPDCVCGQPLRRRSGYTVACRGIVPLNPQQAEGKHLYAVRCAHCHQDNDLELKKVPPDLHGMFEHGTLPSGAAATDAEVERVILAGKGLMPGFDGRFTRDQLHDLLAWLHTGSCLD